MTKIRTSHLVSQWSWAIQATQNILSEASLWYLLKKDIIFFPSLFGYRKWEYIFRLCQLWLTSFIFERLLNCHKRSCLLEIRVSLVRYVATKAIACGLRLWTQFSWMAEMCPELSFRWRPCHTRRTTEAKLLVSRPYSSSWSKMLS